MQNFNSGPEFILLFTLTPSRANAELEAEAEEPWELEEVAEFAEGAATAGGGGGFGLRSLTMLGDIGEGLEDTLKEEEDVTERFFRETVRDSWIKDKSSKWTKNKILY